MKKFKAAPVIPLILALALNVSPGLAAPAPDFLAEAVCLAEASTGEILYEKNADARRGPDALVKIMTLLLAAEAVESGEVSRSETVDDTGSAFYGMTFADLLRCAYIGGDDGACNAIAGRVSGGTEAFVAAMNARAEELGCSGTRFANAHGAPDAAQYTTARDMSAIVRAAAGNALFTEIASARSYDVPAAGESAARRLSNANYMIIPSRERYYYKYAVFGGISATYENGCGCAAFAEREEFSAVAVVLGARAILLEDQSTEMQNLTEARRLFEWGFSNYSRRDVISSRELVARAEVAFGSGADYVNLRPDRNVTLLLPTELGEDDISRETRVYSEEAGEPVRAPVEAGEELGEIIVSRGGRELARAKLVADSAVPLLRAKFIRKLAADALRSRWAKIIGSAAAALFLAYAAIVVRYNIIRARRVKRINDVKRRIAEERRRGGDE
ncbi:MAG: hypothetical protein LBD49_04800 [Oscillospiraceae bacterium]|jgi:D-alanyl-D-alanine carboxypeptidase (penicillin-binding protein 5/6)|nr:hypothetical protein [Oscillospiraceae bacterium]